MDEAVAVVDGVKLVEVIDEVMLEERIDVIVDEAIDDVDDNDDNDVVVVSDDTVDGSDVGTLCKKAGSGRGVPDIFVNDSRSVLRLRSMIS